MSKIDRIPYVEACRRSRLSRERLADSELSTLVRAWRLWAVCNEMTAGYSKAADRIHVVTLANSARMRADKASPLLREFDRLGIFVWRKDQGRRSTGFLALPSLGSQPVSSVEEAAAPGAPQELTPTCPRHPQEPLVEPFHNMGRDWECDLCAKEFWDEHFAPDRSKTS